MSLAHTPLCRQIDRIENSEESFFVGYFSFLFFVSGLKGSTYIFQPKLRNILIKKYFDPWLALFYIRKLLSGSAQLLTSDILVLRSSDTGIWLLLHHDHCERSSTQLQQQQQQRTQGPICWNKTKSKGYTTMGSYISGWNIRCGMIFSCNLRTLERIWIFHYACIGLILCVWISATQMYIVKSGNSAHKWISVYLTLTFFMQRNIFS